MFRRCIAEVGQSIRDSKKAKIPAEVTSPDIAEDKRRQLSELLLEAFSEDRLDLGALKRALGEGAVIESGERYAPDLGR